MVDPPNLKLKKSLRSVSQYWKAPHAVTVLKALIAEVEALRPESDHEGRSLKTFEELDLIAPVRRALANEQYETPTPIQAKTVPPALMGRDVLGCAQTGTGKTAAFALPIPMHGNKSQNARQQALAAFQRKQVQVLVATDVAARGIDIDGITHVVNFDFPHEPENYVYRIGRTGRAGGVGIALSFCSETERSELGAIEKFIGKTLDIFIDQHLSRPQPAKNQSRFAAETSKVQRGGSGKARDESTPDDKPKRKRCRGRNARQRVKQTQ